MDAIGDSYLKEQLQERRARLLVSTRQGKENSSLLGLLMEVDDALKRMEEGTYGLCETCHKNFGLSAEELVGACTEDLISFRQGRPQTDDLSMMIMRRVE